MGNFVFVAIMIIGMMVLGVVIVVTSLIREKRRTEQLREVAAEMSFEFLMNDSDLLARLAGFPLFSQGRSRRMGNVLNGASSDTDVSIFDYSYTTGSGKNSTTFRQTVICFRSERLSLPKFELRPERWYHKIGSLVGFEDIDFADYPRFSKQYLLRGEDEASIRDIFTARVIEYFEGQEGLCVEGSGDRLTVYRAGKRVKPQQIRDFLETGFGVYTVLVDQG